MTGSTISHYTILEKIGEGGMGVVYKAHDTRLDRTVAIKFLPRQVASSEAERSRFNLEARAAAALNHPNVATIYAIEETDDETFIVMEYVEGQELKEKMKDGPLPIDEAVRIATQIAEGLQAAHRKEIVHRDIKSANIMLTGAGQVKVMDFGLAKVRGAAQVTKVGTTIGTAAYMSPEQARGDEVDTRTDIWSFGVVLYEMVTGRLPFKSDYDQAVTYAIVHEEPEHLAAVRPDVPVFLRKVVMKAMAKRAEERYQDMATVLQELRSGGASTPAGDGATKTGGNEEQRGRVQRRTVLISILGVVVVGAVAVGVWKGLVADRTIPESRVKRLAVLPLENLGPAEQEYFADGLTGEITSKLSGISGLAVIARSSAMQYKKTDKTLKQIGEELKVDYVLEGTLQWAKNAQGGGRIRVNPELIRLADATQVWSQPYEADFSDAFKLQVDIAATVAGALNITLGSSEQESLRGRLTDNPQAYDIYLSALPYSDDINDEKGLRIAEQLFLKAIGLDSGFAAAYAGLSKVQSDMYWTFFERTETNQRSSRQNAARALSLDPGLAVAHAAMGHYYYHGELNYDSALKEYHEAIRLQPNDVEAIGGIGFVLRRQGDMMQAVEYLKKALDFNPRDFTTVFSVGETYVLLREYEKAQPYLESAGSLSPDAARPFAFQALRVLLSRGDTREARAIMETALERRIGVGDPGFGYYLFLCDLIEGDLGTASHRLAGSGGMDHQFFFRPEDLFAARAFELMNSESQAREKYDSARRNLEIGIEQHPEDSRLHSSLGLAYAGLGRKSDAIREGKRGLDLMPISQDAWRGTFRLLDLAQIYTMVGEPELALDALDDLLGRPTDAISVALVEIDPTWTPLRTHPRFRNMLKKHSGNRR
jgi:TolB-like protein/Flp pilus assembly protein TadD/predicted Ser/Thr protein kinase